MHILITMHSDIPIYEQIKQQIKALILQGKLKQDEQLPSIRSLAKELQVGIITVKRAYDDLVLEDYIYAKLAKGYYVAQMNIKAIKQIYQTKIETLVKEIKDLQYKAQIEDEAILNLFKVKGK